MGGGRQKTGDRRWETGDRRRESLGGRQETGEGRVFSDAISKNCTLIIKGVNLSFLKNTNR